MSQLLPPLHIAASGVIAAIIGAVESHAQLYMQYVRMHVVRNCARLHFQYCNNEFSCNVELGLEGTTTVYLGTPHTCTLVHTPTHPQSATYLLHYVCVSMHFTCKYEETLLCTIISHAHQQEGVWTLTSLHTRTPSALPWDRGMS